MDTYVRHAIVYRNKSTGKAAHYNVIAEEPLSIRVQGKPYSVVMRTPGDEVAHVAGFCLAEGILDDPEDFISIGFCDGSDTNVVTVTLKPFRRESIAPLLQRRGFVSQSSCGICGKEILKDLYQIVHPLRRTVPVDVSGVLKCLESLSDLQPLRRETRGCHAAALYDRNFRLIAVAEDVGRHNALDKAIGKAFLDRSLKQAAFLNLSSRISYELVQKAARAKIPIIMALSRPTALAVELASELKITLATLDDDGGLLIFCGAERLSG